MSVARFAKLHSAARFTPYSRVWLPLIFALIAIGSTSSILGLSGFANKEFSFILVSVSSSVAGWLLLRRALRINARRFSPAEMLAGNLSRALSIDYLRHWLQATILNPAALTAYWHCNETLRLEELSCYTSIRNLDARHSFTLKGETSQLYSRPLARC